MVEPCYDNGSIDATQKSDSTLGYSDCGICATGNMFFQDEFSCGGSYATVTYYPNNIKPQIRPVKSVTGTAIATEVNLLPLPM